MRSRYVAFVLIHLSVAGLVGLLVGRQYDAITLEAGVAILAAGLMWGIISIRWVKPLIVGAS
jgi:hypothetical protein